LKHNCVVSWSPGTGADVGCMCIVAPGQGTVILVKNDYNHKRKSVRPAPRPRVPVSEASMDSVVVGSPVRACFVVFSGRKCVGRGWPEATLSG